MDAPAAVTFRRARRADLPAVLELLNDGKVGNVPERIEDPMPRAYDDAFAAIEADPNQLLLVGEAEGRIVRSLQLTFIPGIAHQGAWRAQVEAVRVARELRDAGDEGELQARDDPSLGFADQQQLVGIGLDRREGIVVSPRHRVLDSLGDIADLAVVQQLEDGGKIGAARPAERDRGR